MIADRKKFEQRIYKYATGDAPPTGSQYLGTVTQTSARLDWHADGSPRWEPCWLVWHYFLVQVEVEA